VHCTKISAKFECGGPPGSHPKNVALGYDVEKISAGCLLHHKMVEHKNKTDRKLS